jgi:PIN domain nuclease of toxin-antitoxin system
MANFVIDTNVGICANGRDTHASLRCQLTCSDFLETCRTLHIALDNQNLIMSEYEKHFYHKGEPGMGDAFFKYLYHNQHAGDKIQLVKITPINEEKTEFAELPENQVDPSDRKFLATALVAKAILVNATDSDWTEQKNLLESLQIEVKQLCPEHSCK